MNTRYTEPAQAQGFASDKNEKHGEACLRARVSPRGPLSLDDWRQ